MGANASREVSINEGENKESIPRSSTLPAGLKGLGEKFNFSGSLPRGLGLESSFSVKLTKSKKLDSSPSKKEIAEVEIVAEEEGKEENPDGDETLAEFVESIISTVIEDTLEKSRKMKRSNTLPPTFRGLGRLNRTNSFGKRIRQSFRKLVAVKKPTVETTEESLQEEILEEKEEVKLEVKAGNEAEVDGDEDGDQSKTTENKNSLQGKFKKIDFEAKKKQFQATLKKMVQKNRKPKKESIELINSIIDEIIEEVESVPHESEEPEVSDEDGSKLLESLWSKRDDEMFATVVEEKKDRVGVLDRSND